MDGREACSCPARNPYARVMDVAAPLSTQPPPHFLPPKEISDFPRNLLALSSFQPFHAPSLFLEVEETKTEQLLVFP